MHFICDIPKKEGIYHVRIYDVAVPVRPNREKATLDGHASFAGLFDRTSGKDLAIPISGDLVYEDNFGDFQQSRASEVEQGGHEHQNFKISFEADPAVESIIASIRDLSISFGNHIKEVWMEITLEQPALNVPDLIPLRAIAPRKTRSVFWGRLVRNEAQGYSDYQKYKEGLIRDPKVRMHVGGLDFTFEHWLHVRMNETFIGTNDENALWLWNRINFYFPPVANQTVFAKLSEVLYMILEGVSPTALFATFDKFLAEKYHWQIESSPSTLDYNNNTDRCNIMLPVPVHPTVSAIFPTGWFLGDLYWKAAVSGPVTANQDYRALFTYLDNVNKPDPGQYSLYSKWKNFGDALIGFTKEFFYTFDVEIPTMAEAVTVYLGSNVTDNTQDNRSKHWQGVTRWLFIGLGDDLDATITARPQEKTIKYSPCAAWLSHLKVTEPIDASSDIEIVCEFWNGVPEGFDISFETLTRFCAQKVPALGGGDDERGYELWVMGPFSIIDLARTADYAPGPDFFNPLQSQDWADAHCKRRVALWNGARSIIEFDQEGVGLVAWDNKDIASFGFLDWGDFAMMRYFFASPGLLFEQGIVGKFDILEISRKPGGDTHIKAIERGSFIDTSVTIVTPPPPRIETPPVFSGSPVCGTITVTFCIEYDGGCIDHADVTINGQFNGTFNNFPDPMPDDLVCVTVVINTANLPNGGNTVCITFTLCDPPGGTVSACWNFTVQNPCTGGNTTQHDFAP